MEGNEVPNVSNITASAGLDVRYPLDLFGGLGHAIMSADISYHGPREADIGNTYEIEGYTIANLTLGMEREGFEIYAYGRNLFDERPIYFASTFTPTAHSSIVGKGRQLGVGLRARW